jgi:hypothetical protein
VDEVAGGFVSLGIGLIKGDQSVVGSFVFTFCLDNEKVEEMKTKW